MAGAVPAEPQPRAPLTERLPRAPRSPLRGRTSQGAGGEQLGSSGTCRRAAGGGTRRWAKGREEQERGNGAGRG